MSHPRDASIDGLLKWCRTTSSAFMFKDGLIAFKTKEDGNVTAFAVKEIPADTALVKVPPELMFSSKDLKRKWRSTVNEIESKVRRYVDSMGGFLGGPEAEEAPTTMALAFALLLELGDPESRWKPYWDSFPEYVPSIFDFDGDLELLDGSPWKEEISKKKQHMDTILKSIIPPILAKFEGKLGVDDVEGTLKRAYGIWQSRQLKDDVHGRKAHYLVPVLDLIDGEGDKLSNVIVDDGPGSTPMHIELVLKSSRKIEAGEELRQMYDSCSNASYLQWYGYITDSMVFGNLSHRTYLTADLITAKAVEAVEKGSEDSEETKELKKFVLARIEGDPARQFKRTLELSHRSEVFEEAAQVLSTVSRIAVVTDPEVVKTLVEHAKSPDLKQMLAGISEKMEGIDKEKVAPLALSAVDSIIERLPNGHSFVKDMVALDKQATKESDRLLIKVRMSEKFLLLRVRAEVCRHLGVPNQHEKPRVCDHCATFRTLRACSHCGTTPYCSRACQVAKWKEHKKLVNHPPGTEITKAA